jgi:hypothetical protein
LDLELINKNINRPRALSSGSPNLRKANEGFFILTMNEQIKASDIRIGNWLQTLNAAMQEKEPSVLYTQQYIQVKGITEKGINPYFFNGGYVQEIRCGRDFEMLNGVVLTLEILEKAGFKKNTGWLLVLANNYRISYYELNQDFELSWIPDNGEWQYIDLPNFKYLHELQNFVFSLTSTELKIEL